MNNYFFAKTETDKKEAIRKAYLPGMIKAVENNPKIISLVADWGKSLTLVPEFVKKYPHNFIDVGVAEANMFGIAAGLAIGGFLPFAGTSASFICRGFDHIRQSIVQNFLNVKIVGSHGGISNARDGASAHGLEDIGLMRTLVNMQIVVPCDFNETVKAVFAMSKDSCYGYLRLYREPTAVFTDPSEPFVIGRAKIYRVGKDLTIIACGPQVFTALEVAEMLKGQISIEVINCHTIFPLDREAILKSARKTKRVITLEDHNIHGGLGSAIAEFLVENFPIPMQRIGINEVTRTGTYEELIKLYGLDKERVAISAANFVRRNRA